MAGPQTIENERCKCGHTSGAHGFRGEPGCTFCSCEHFERPVVQKQQIALTQYGKRALELLSRQPNFKGTPRDILARMLADGHGRMYPAGDYLVRRGSNTHTLHVILSGQVTVEPPLAAVDAGGPHPKAIVAGEGELVGDLRAFSGEERWASVVTNNPVEALEISTTKLKPIFADYPDLFMTLATNLARFTGNLGDFDATAELVNATLDMALAQYASSASSSSRKDGLDPDKAMDIRRRWQEMKEADHEDRARQAARQAIEAQTARRRR